jgi:hypothetical protein
MSGGRPITVRTGMRRAGSMTGSLVRRARRSHALATAVLLTLAIALGVLVLARSMWVPITSLLIPLLLGGMLLSFRWLVVLTFLCLSVAAYRVSDEALSMPRAGLIVVFGIAAWVVLAGGKVRSRLGVQGTRGESMLIELRDILTRQGELPDLPSGWKVEAKVRSAHGASFSGDFVVSATTQRRTMLEVALVDVSGKGLDAGTRALLLSGAFGGLLGVVRVEEFLPSANEYLRRQEWDDEFATVVHVAVNLANGDFEVRTAGHPPAIHYDAWSGRWQTQDTTGPLLGLLEKPQFPAESGQLKPGDALFLYSDGMVETRRRDIRLGTDRLIGHAERLVTIGFAGAAGALVDEIGGTADDSALVLIHREMNPTAPGDERPDGRPRGTRRSLLPASFRRRRPTSPVHT